MARNPAFGILAGETNARVGVRRRPLRRVHGGGANIFYIPPEGGSYSRSPGSSDSCVVLSEVLTSELTSTL
jgi:hypothetical protein